MFLNGFIGAVDLVVVVVVVEVEVHVAASAGKGPPLCFCNCIKQAQFILRIYIKSISNDCIFKVYNGRISFYLLIV